jgi:hypothetical protein
MKNLLFVILFLGASCNQPRKQRYFFVGYTTGGTVSGNYYISGKGDGLPNVDSLTYYIWKNNECEYKFGYKVSDYVIVGLYEFKDSVEFRTFKNGRDEPMINCDSQQTNK